MYPYKMYSRKAWRLKPGLAPTHKLGEVCDKNYDNSNILLCHADLAIQPNIPSKQFMEIHKGTIITSLEFAQGYRGTLSSKR